MERHNNTYIEQRPKPKPLSGDGRWMVVKRHAEGGYPLAWSWVVGGEPPSIDDLPPISPDGTVVHELQAPLVVVKRSG